MKRICSLLLALVMVIGMFPASAKAAELDNGLEYVIYEDHVEITGYTGDATEVVIPDEIEGLPVTVIGRFAFSQCSILTSINLPNTVTQINEYAFSRCTNLTSISLPDGLISIATDVFSGCSSLTSISIPDSVTRIGSNAFSNCSSLTSISIPDGVTSIGTYTFSGCTSLTSISIPDSITHIYGDAFKNCTSLTSIDLSDGLVMIAGYAFRGCSNLTSISIPGSVKELGACVFSDCTSLSSIYFVGDPPYMVGAFSGLTATAYYPAENPAWAPHTMMNAGGSINWISYESEHTHNYVAIVTAPTCTEQGYTTYTCVCGESYISDYVVALGHHYENGFCTNCGIGIGDYPTLELETDLVITSSDDGYTYVTFTPETSGSYVFYNKDTGDTDAALYTADMVELAYSDDCWEDHGFHGSLSFCITYDLEAGQTYVLGAAFLSGKIADMTIRVDRNHSYEKTITKEPTCTEEGEATYTCTVCGYSYTDSVPSILSFEIYSDHVIVSDCYDYGNLAELVIPTEYEDLPVTGIGDFAFWGCSSLTGIVLPDSITHIGDSAFEHCGSLTSIIIPESVTYIGNSALSHCWGMIEICVDENNSKYSSDAYGVLFDKEKTQLIQAPCALMNCFESSDIQTYAIPNSVTSINDAAFANCGFLRVIIPDSVTYIGNDAFSESAIIGNISIPASVTHIGQLAFSNCSADGIYVDENNLYYSSDDHGVLFDKKKTYLIQAPNQTLGGSYSIPDGVIHIGDSAFLFCYRLTNIEIPESVISIGEDSFSGCEFTSITIPSSVTSIGKMALSFCFELTTIYFKGNSPDFAEDIFYEVTSTAYYPAGNPTWTEDVMQDYGGTITWVAYDSSHTHEYSAAVTAPTCTEEGYTTYTCSCGDSYVSDYVDALGHDYADGICTRCGEADPDYVKPVENPFTDVPAGCWYEAPVLWALENGITDGTSATTFSPGNQCLRAHVVTFLWNAEETPAPAAASSTFTDVPAGAWYEKPVLWAVENGITSGVSPTKFGAGDVCSRYQVVFFLWKAAGSPEPKTTVNPFTDVTPGHFFYKAVLWAVENGITSGTSDTTFSPTQPCNRAQVVTFLYAAYN